MPRLLPPGSVSRRAWVGQRRPPGCNGSSDRRSPARVFHRGWTLISALVKSLRSSHARPGTRAGRERRRLRPTNSAGGAVAEQACAFRQRRSGSIDSCSPCRGSVVQVCRWRVEVSGRRLCDRRSGCRRGWTACGARRRTRATSQCPYAARDSGALRRTPPEQWPPLRINPSRTGRRSCLTETTCSSRRELGWRSCRADQHDQRRGEAPGGGRAPSTIRLLASRFTLWIFSLPWGETCQGCS